MRRAELVMAVVLAALSLYFMWESSKLPIGWIPDSGPGGGAFPFWLSIGMLICSIIVIVRWFRRATPPSQSDEPFMDERAFRMFLFGAGTLTGMIALIHVVGVYGSVPLFLAVYMRIMGGHRWSVTGTTALAAPIGMFFFFEIALNITLPKGYTEPLFYPLYDIFL